MVWSLVAGGVCSSQKLIPMKNCLLLNFIVYIAVAVVVFIIIIIFIIDVSCYCFYFLLMFVVNFVVVVADVLVSLFLLLLFLLFLLLLFLLLLLLLTLMVVMMVSYFPVALKTAVIQNNCSMSWRSFSVFRFYFKSPFKNICLLSISLHKIFVLKSLLSLVFKSGVHFSFMDFFFILDCFFCFFVFLLFFLSIL